MGYAELLCGWDPELGTYERCDYAIYSSKTRTDSHDEIMIGIGAWAGKGVPKTRQDSHKTKKRRCGPKQGQTLIRNETR